MRKIKLYEDFNSKTLDINNTTYNNYFKVNKRDRPGMVAWRAKDSQVKNFELISNHIKDGDSLLDYGCGIGDILKYLEDKKKISDYLGVDINENFISQAKKDYPDNNFQLIKDSSEINGKYDVVCASGVFTWFITKEDFTRTINNLYEIANREVLLTFLFKENVDWDSNSYWDSKYRRYNEEMFGELFDYEIKFDYTKTKDTLLVRLIK